MVFSAAGPVSRQATERAGGSGGSESGEHSVLLAKIHALEAGMATAKQEAFESGYRRGEQEAREAITPVLARMSASIAEVIAMRPELRRLAEKDTVTLALKIARRILHRELSVDHGALNALARVVFDRLSRAEAWQLKVHPQFVDGIRNALPAGVADRVNIEADSLCDPGTFLVRYSEGEIDASVDSQLEEISRGLTDRLAG